MVKHSKISICLGICALILSTASANAIVFPVTVDDSQFNEDNTLWEVTKFIDENDRFQTIRVLPGGRFTADFKLDTYIAMRDPPPEDSSESIHFTLEKPSPAGTPPLFTPGTTGRYVFRLTDTEPAQLANIVFTGNLPTAPGSGGALEFSDNVNIIGRGGAGRFGDVHLEITLNTGQLEFSSITVGVDAEEIRPTSIPVPEPDARALLVGGIVMLGLNLRSRRNNTKPC